MQETKYSECSAIFLIPKTPLIKSSGESLPYISAVVGKDLEEKLKDKNMTSLFLNSAVNIMDGAFKGYEVNCIKLKDPDGKNMNVYFKSYPSYNLKIAAINKGKNSIDLMGKMLEVFYLFRDKAIPYIENGVISNNKADEIQSNLFTKIEKSIVKSEEVILKKGQIRLSYSGIYLLNPAGLCYANVKGKNIENEVNEEEDLVTALITASNTVINQLFNKSEKDKCELDLIELNKDNKKMKLYFKTLNEEINIVAAFNCEVDKLELSSKMNSIHFLINDLRRKYLLNSKEFKAKAEAGIKIILDR